MRVRDKMLTIQDKLVSLSRCVHRIEDQGDLSQEVLEADIDKCDIVVLNIERAVQLCVDIGGSILSAKGLDAPKTMAETFTLLEEAGIMNASLSSSMRAAVGFRNIAVHQYSALKMDIVSKIARERLGDFRAFAAMAADAFA